MCGKIFRVFVQLYLLQAYFRLARKFAFAITGGAPFVGRGGRECVFTARCLHTDNIVQHILFDESSWFARDRKGCTYRTSRPAGSRRTMRSTRRAVAAENRNRRGPRRPMGSCVLARSACVPTSTPPVEPRHLGARHRVSSTRTRETPRTAGAVDAAASKVVIETES